jgi:hypothetical protein
MAFNGSGTFLINTAGQPVVAGTVISSTAFNALTADLATGLSTVITKDGQTTVTANIPMSTYKFTGLGVGSAATDSANLSQVQSTVTKLLTSVSGTDTITAVGAPVVAAYAAGQMFYFVATGDNTGAVTLNIDSLGAKAVTRDGSVALAAGDIKSGEVVVVVYDGTRFQVVSQLNSAGNATFANVSITSALNVGGVVTLSGGTANGVLYLNGSKVATSGSALTFDGSTFGITSSAVSTGNINSTNANGSAFIFQNSGTSVGWVGNGSSSFVGASASNFGINGQTNLLFGVSGFEKARLDSSGNLGLGVSPSAWASPFKNIQVGNGAGFTGRTDAMTAYMSSNYYYNNGDKYIGTGNATLYIQISGQHIFYTAPSGTAGNAISSTQAMTLDASGNLLVGTTSPLYSTAGRGLLEVNGSSSALCALKINNTAGGYLFHSGTDLLLVNTISGALRFDTNNTERARITSGGDFQVGSTNYAIIAKGADTNGQGWNGAQTSLYVGSVTGTGRSINAAGTVNASGADYAEYMEKAGNFVIAKGDVCGINANGKLTNVYADAVSFVVKSTNPSYVGNDDWGGNYENDAEGLEAARQKVDRIAFAGQVPVNVLGATPGQYIVPANDNGAIKGVAVSNPSFEQYQAAVGKVIAVEDDGRAKIIVKIA